MSLIHNLKANTITKPSKINKTRMQCIKEAILIKKIKYINKKENPI